MIALWICCARSMATENSAFARVLRDLDPVCTAAAGTPMGINSRRLESQSPRPLQMTSGAAPCLNNSAVRTGRSWEPPPKTISTSAFTSPLSTVKTCCGKNRLVNPSKTSAARPARKNRNNRRLKNFEIIFSRGPLKFFTRFGHDIRTEAKRVHVRPHKTIHRLLRRVHDRLVLVETRVENDGRS